MSNAIQKGVGLSKISFFGQFQEGGDRDASNFIFGGESVYVGQNFVQIVIQNEIKPVPDEPYSCSYVLQMVLSKIWQKYHQFGKN